MLNLLGKGCFGEVWISIEKCRKRKVAVKIENKKVSYLEPFFSIFILMTKIRFRIGTLFNMKKKFTRILKKELESQK